MSKFSKGLLLAMSVFAVLNLGIYLIPMGVEGFPYRRMGFPRTFWHDYGDHSTFRSARLAADVVFAGIVSYGFARWYQGPNPRY